jgi:DNA-binding MarR family transcriptional regulator
MKLQIETVKALLEIIEKSNDFPDPFYLLPEDAEALEIDYKTMTYHLCLMLESGLINGSEHTNKDRKRVLIRRLTWEGHAFLANAKNPTLWNKLKELSSSAGGFSLDVAKLTLSTLATSTINSLIKGS